MAEAGGQVAVIGRGRAPAWQGVVQVVDLADFQELIAARRRARA